MRRQRILRASSAHTLCIFCAARFNATSTTAPRRRLLNTTAPPHQSAAAAAHTQEQSEQPPPPLRPQPQHSFDADGELTQAEIREKEARRQARLAREAEQERLRVADFERRHVEKERSRAAERAAAEEADKRRIADMERRLKGREQRDAERRAEDAKRKQEQRQQRVSQQMFGARGRGAQKKPMAMPSISAESRGGSGGFGGDWGSSVEDIKPLEYGEMKEGPQRPDQDAFGAALHDTIVPNDKSRFQPVRREQRRQPRDILASGGVRDTFWDSSRGGGDSSPSFRQSGGMKKMNFNNHRRLELSTGYQATPFSPAEYQQSAPIADENQESNWQHLTRRNSSANPAPPPPPPPVDRVHTTYQQSGPFDDAEAIERSFRLHQQSRLPPPPRNNSYDPFPSRAQSLGPQSAASKRCARCLAFGHVARECTSPVVRATCNFCGQQGHLARHCPQKKMQMSGRDETQGNRSLFGNGDQDRTSRIRLVRATPTIESAEARASHMHGVVGHGNLRGTQPAGEPPFKWKDSAERDSRMRAASGARESVRDAMREPPLTFQPFSTPAEAERTEPPRAERHFQPSAREERVEPSQLESRFQPPVKEAPAEAARRARRTSRGFDDPTEEEPTFDKRRDKKASRREIQRRDEEADDEAAAAREERAARKAARKAAREAEKAVRSAQVHLPEFISIQNLAQTLGVHYDSFVQRLERLGYEDLFPNKTLNAETSGMIAMEYDFEPIFDQSSSTQDAERDLHPQPEPEDRSSLPPRPPVVTIMGHVDHGKTTLLDFLRKSSVAAGEAGGITQHIGAFSVPMSASGKTITFLDTPGHAAFLAMRQRGANVTDIVVLVVAADDSVKPQTLESLRCAKEAGVPILVAINKVDKEGADVRRVKQDLARNGVEIEDFGGDVQVVEVSGKTGQGMEQLEEAIVTLSEILDHRADEAGGVEGWVLEATTKAHGRIATVLVKRGTLRPGNMLVAGKTWARVRTLRNERGEVVETVAPGMPVEVDGWRDDPVAGDQVLEAPSEQKAGSVVEFRREVAERKKMEADMEAINQARKADQAKRAMLAEKEKRNSRLAGYGDFLEFLSSPDEPEEKSVEEKQEEQGQITVPFLIKADVSGSAEAVAAYIPSLTSPLITPQILHSGVGPIHQSDIDLISAAGGHIIAFNLPPNEGMKGVAERLGVRVLENNVIYRVLEDVKEVLEERLPAITRQRVLGEADVSAAFDIGAGGRKTVRIAGCKVRNGVVGRGSRVRVTRGGEKVYDGVITSLKNVKKDVQEMRKGTECGMGFDGWEDFQVGDVVQTYEEISEKRKL